MTSETELKIREFDDHTKSISNVVKEIVSRKIVSCSIGTIKKLSFC